MGDLLKAIQILPIAVCITTIIYLIYYVANREKLKQVTKIDKFIRYVFIGWWVMFIYITQLMPFGNGMGERINLNPLHPLVIAAKYGLENAPMVSQLLLNTLMFVPLGFLLPLVFKNKFNSFISVLAVSFSTTFLTEFIQLFTLRGTDIDDIITNTLGGVLGFGLYILYCFIYNFLIGKKNNKEITIHKLNLKAIISVILIIVTIAPFQIIKFIDSKREFGQVYYGHLIPEEIEITGNISSEEITGIVYKAVDLETKEEVAERLNKITGFNIEFHDDTYGTYSGEKDSKAIYIYEDNTWCVDYALGEDRNIDISKIPNENEARVIAEEHLEKFQIDLSSLEYVGIDDGYGDEYLHLLYTPKNTDKNRFIFGDIIITVGEDGNIISINDRRIHTEFYKEVELTSPNNAINIASNVGVGPIKCKASVFSVEPNYYYNKSTGYLIPTWEVIGEMTNKYGDTYSWTPNIEAIKK